MIKPMFGYRPKSKEFNYQPRYYDPKKEERNRRRIRFTRKRAKDRQTLRVLVYAAILAFIVWIISVL